MACFNIEISNVACFSLHYERWLLTTKTSLSVSYHHHHHHHIYLPYCKINFKDIYSMLLGEETSGNHQAYRRGHLDITILNEIRAAKECGRN